MSNKPGNGSFAEQALFRLERELAQLTKSRQQKTVAESSQPDERILFETQHFPQPARQPDIRKPFAEEAKVNGDSKIAKVNKVAENINNSKAIENIEVSKGAKKPVTRNHYEGHRERLRQRFINNGEKTLEDYEMLELLLFRVIPRADTKPLAKALLARFGSFADVLGADTRLLQEVPGCGAAVATDLKLIAAAAARMGRTKLHKRNIFSSWDQVIAYCKTVMSHETREQFRILFLDKKNGLIADEIHQTGTIDHIPVYPREVFKRAHELGASALVLVHNHPSGDPTPSGQDISMTMKLRDAAEILGIVIHDHIIIGRNSHTSFRALDLL